MLPETINSPADSPQPVFRKAQPQDGARMHALVKEMGGLELNTAYFYVLYCMDFADTCVVAEVDGKLAGFVLGHRPPARPDTVFVWQVGVAPFMRRQGMARRLLDAVLDRKSTRLNSSHVAISYAVFCLKKQNHEHLGIWR